MIIISEDIILNAYKHTAYICGLLVLGLFLIRVIYAQMTAQPHYVFLAVLKGLVTYYILAFIFPFIISFSYSLPETVAEFVRNQGPQVREIEESAFDFLPDLFRSVWDFSTIVMYNVARFLDSTYLLLISFTAPIVFFFSCMFGMMAGVTILMGAVIVNMFVPVMNGMLDVLVLVVRADPDNGVMMIATAEIIVAAAKLVLPIFIGGIVMFTSVGKAFVSGVQSIVSPPNAGRKNQAYSVDNVKAPNMGRMQTQVLSSLPGGKSQKQTASSHKGTQHVVVTVKTTAAQTVRKESINRSLHQKETVNKTSSQNTKTQRSHSSSEQRTQNNNKTHQINTRKNS
jgi:hypothetical protein